MRLLLTSAGVKNTSIHNALVDLLGKPIADSSALCIPTAMHGHPHVGPGEGPWRLSVADPTIPCASWDGSPWECGLADLLPSLSEMVWVGLSGGSMVMTPRIGDDFVGWKPPTSGDETLGVVDFPICPHVNPEGMPGNSMAEAESWAARIEGPAYAIDDETAIKVTDGNVEVAPEGHWRLFAS